VQCMAWRGKARQGRASKKFRFILRTLRRYSQIRHAAVDHSVNFTKLCCPVLCALIILASANTAIYKIISFISQTASPFMKRWSWINTAYDRHVSV
jgi:hypothetical protein